MNDIDADSLHIDVLNIYFNTKIESPSSAEIKMCVYKFIDSVYELNFFSDENNDINSFDNMEKWFKRNIRNKK